MKLKLAENGSVVLVDEKPVYVYEDGKEVPFDAPAAVKKIAELNEESKTHRLTAKEAADKLKAWEGIDPEAARTAIATVQNFTDKKLIDAGDVDKLKKQMAEQFKEDIENMKKGYETKLGEAVSILGKKDQTIFNLLVTSRFATSPVMDKLTIPADMARDTFGKHFVVEEQDGTPVVVGHYNNEKILSRERPGEPADFDEAFQYLVEKYPMKDRIIKGGQAGSGGAGGAGGSGNGGKLTGEQVRGMSLSDYEQAKKDGRIAV